MIKVWCWESTLLFVLWTLGAVCVVPLAVVGEPASADAKLDAAIATMRHIDPDKLSTKEKEARTKALDRAWETIEAAGPRGIERLKREIAKIDASGEQDEFFKLSASTLLFKLKQFEELDVILPIWNSARLTYDSPYVSWACLSAASTRDPRALPLLRVCMRTWDGTIEFPGHGRLDNDGAHYFVWGIYGPGGLPALKQILETSTDTKELRVALWLLGNAAYLDALPTIRPFVRHQAPESRREAIMTLGRFGHPQDFALLLSGLTADDMEDVFAYVWALAEFDGYAEFDNSKAIAGIIPLLRAKNAKLRNEAIYALYALVTPEALEALQAHAESTSEPKETKRTKELMAKVMQAMKLNREAYLGKSAEEKKALVAAARRELLQRGCLLKKQDRRLSRAEFLKLAENWKTSLRLDRYDLPPSERYEIKERHLLSVATPDDIPLLLDVKAAVLMRQSDEAYYEAKLLDRVVHLLGRSRYRQAWWRTESADEGMGPAISK